MAGLCLPPRLPTGAQHMPKRAPEQPDFEPDVITLLDFLSKWIRKRFFGRIAGGGGLYKRLIFCTLLAYWYPY
jgi:hypothetical protein